MSLARTHAWISGIAWLAICVAFAVYLARDGVEPFAGPEGDRARDVVAWIIVPGYLINFAIMAWERRGRRDGRIDERDGRIERRATEITAIVPVVGFFLASVALYDRHAEAGSVPVGWLFVLAYGSIAVVSLVHPAVRLILDLTGRVDA